MAVRTIETNIILGGEKEFNSQMKNVNSNLKTLRTDMSAVTSEFKKNENSAQALSAKMKVLKETYAQQKEAVNILAQRHKAMVEQYGEESAQADKAKQALNAATVQMNKTKDAIDDTSDALRKHITHLGAVKDAYNKIPELGRKAFSAVAKGALNMSKAALTAGAATAAGLGAIAVSGLKTIGEFAVDGANRAKETYEQANELYHKAQEAAAAGNYELAAQYMQQVDELMAGLDTDYYHFSQTIDHFKDAQTNAKDALGKILLPTLEHLASNGSALLNEFAEAMDKTGGDTEKMGETISTYLGKGIELIANMLPEMTQTGVDLLNGLLDGLSNPETLNLIIDSGGSILDTLLGALEENAPKLGTMAITIISRLASGLIQNAPRLIVGGAELILKILQGLAKELPNLVKEIMALPGKLLQAFRESDVDWAGIGRDIMNGIWDGLVEVWNQLVEWFNSAIASIGNAIDSIGNAMSNAFSDPDNDPLRDLYPNTNWNARGYNEPLMFTKPTVIGNQGFGDGPGGEIVYGHAALMRDIKEAVRSTDAPGTGGVIINIYGYDVKDDQELAERMSRELKLVLDRRSA